MEAMPRRFLATRGPHRRVRSQPNDQSRGRQRVIPRPHGSFADAGRAAGAADESAARMGQPVHPGNDQLLWTPSRWRLSLRLRGAATVRRSLLARPSQTRKQSVLLVSDRACARAGARISREPDDLQELAPRDRWLVPAIAEVPRSRRRQRQPDDVRSAIHSAKQHHDRPDALVSTFSSAASGARSRGTCFRSAAYISGFAPVHPPCAASATLRPAAFAISWLAPGPRREVGRVGERRLVPRGLPTGAGFLPPPIDPCMRFSRTRLTDVLHRRHSAP